MRSAYSTPETGDPIRIFVGTDRTQTLAARVLEFSIRVTTRLPVDIRALCDVEIPVPKDSVNRPRTGFSFARFLIPALCGYEGRAIYLDADMLVFSDIAELWRWPMGGAHVLCSDSVEDPVRRRQYSVLVMDCGKLPWRVEDIVRGLDEGRYDYRELMENLCIVPREAVSASLPVEWNSLERFEPGRTRLLHYTDMPTQPWVFGRNRHGDVWYSTARRALDEGFLSVDEIYQEVRRGHVNPDLPSWLGLEQPADYEDCRRLWDPPYRRFQGPGNSWCFNSLARWFDRVAHLGRRALGR
ncbi:MAG TPA: glycosyltransferase [Nitrospiraceae bacterium]|nr:glycosyltransferase [Nitrospiraceae bacterium]